MSQTLLPLFKYHQLLQNGTGPADCSHSGMLAAPACPSCCIPRSGFDSSSVVPCQSVPLEMAGLPSLKVRLDFLLQEEVFPNPQLCSLALLVPGAWTAHLDGLELVKKSICWNNEFLRK